MKMIVALGNPGAAYRNTRHNFGWLLMDSLIPEGAWREVAKGKALMAEWELEGERVLVVKPLTFMNKSGEAVLLLARKQGVDPAEVVVVHDDLDISLGQAKLAFDRGAAGHNGVSSVVACLGTKAFWRLRLGIGIGEKRPADWERFVVATFTPEEKEKLPAVYEVGKKLLTEWVKKAGETEL